MWDPTSVEQIMTLDVFLHTGPDGVLAVTSPLLSQQPSSCGIAMLASHSWGCFDDQVSHS